MRQKNEKTLIKSKKNVAYPSYDELDAEVNEEKTQLVFTIKNEDNLVVNKVFRKPSK